MLSDVGEDAKERWSQELGSSCRMYLSNPALSKAAVSPVRHRGHVFIDFSCHLISFILILPTVLGEKPLFVPKPAVAPKAWANYTPAIGAVQGASMTTSQAWPWQAPGEGSVLLLGSHPVPQVPKYPAWWQLGGEEQASCSPR